jgi:hypothetical protein
VVSAARVRVITIVTATAVEYAAAKAVLPQAVRVMRAGISLRRFRMYIDGSAISCGVAGGVRDDVPTGAVLIPRIIRRADGTAVECDQSLVEALITASRALGHEPIDGPLLSTATLVHGADRATYASQGISGVDMETAFIQAQRLACVRVVLDTPKREISPAWLNPASIVFHPGAWRDLPFLAREGPRCARRAASVIARAIDSREARLTNPR